MYNYQTLSQFVGNPFELGYQPSLQEYARKYEELNKRQKIRFGGVLIVDDVYFLHIKVGSETAEGVWYDVVIQFFMDESIKSRNLALNNYYVKFFSNSPGFVYKYGYLYHKNDMLVEVLANKYPKEVLTKEPVKTNAENKMGYDKTVYYACRYVLDHSITLLSKNGLSVIRQRNADKFFEGINTFDDVSENISISKMEQSIRKEARKDPLDLHKQKKEKRDEAVAAIKSIFSGKAKKKGPVTTTVTVGKRKPVVSKKRGSAKVSAKHSTVKKSKGGK